MESFEEKLIELVRDCDIIYNKQSSGYKNTNFKARKWLEISEKLACTEEECMRRWKTLRDRYTKEVKKLDQPSGSAAIPSPPWYLFDAMNFLRTHVAPRKTWTNYISLNKKTLDNASPMESTQDEVEFHEEGELIAAGESDVSVMGVEERLEMTTPLPANSPSTSTSTGIGFAQNRGNKRKKVEELDTHFFDAVKSFETYVEKKSTTFTENKRFTQIIENLLETLSPSEQEEAKSRMFSIITEYAYKKKT